ncbi:MAG: radical SAM family heme chaperone HemW [Bacteroidales bacterium]|nr:radical SAM family heme chaperone HemW [Bacteroidales bacterium]
MAGIYLHIPFCDKKCIYCGFYSVVSKTLRDKYIPALQREIRERGNFFSSLYPADQTVKTLYIGGGTPSVLNTESLKQAINGLKATFCFPNTAFLTDNPDEFEFTIEVNPDDITSDYASQLRQLGVNRISMGVQSFQDQHLIWMGRRHTRSQAISAFRTLRQAGFKNISLDLIFGFPSLTRTQWEENLDTILDLSPEHISAYQLGVDPNTPIEKQVSQGKLTLPDEETCEGMYKTLQRRLAEAGYFQYEVSNFCKEGFHSRHNSSYWNRTPYLGLGPGAHSFINRKREWNFPDAATYCNPTITELREGENLSPEDVFNEILMLGLRTIGGAALKTLRESSPQSDIFISTIAPAIQDQERKGNLVLTTTGTIKIPPEKFFISDGIIRELFV